MKKRYLILPLLTLLLTSNVYAITSNDVTYDNDGTTENLTTTLDNLYSELNKYKTGGSVQSNQMLEGATGYSKGVLVTGTIKSKAATTYTPGTSNQTIAAGQYLSGTQTIKGDTNLVAGNIKSGVSIFGVSGTFTSDANATAANILSGKTAYVNGSKVTGTIASKGATTYTPGTSNQTIAAGQYLSGAQTIKGDANLIAGNIVSGKSIFGVNGTHTALNHSYSVSAEAAKTVGSSSACEASVPLSHALTAGTYLVVAGVSKTDGTNHDVYLDFLSPACNYAPCSGLSVTTIAITLGGNINISAYLVNSTRSWSVGQNLMRATSKTCVYGGPYTVLYDWIKIS